MLLVRNKLKRLKKTIDDDDDMLNYLKYSHLDTLKKPRIDKEDDTENNETHNFQLANIEPKKIQTSNKGVDTGDDFEKIIPPYVSLMYSEDFDRNEKMVQVWTRMLNENLPPSPPSSSSSSSNKSEGYMSKTARRGFRLAEFALNTAITGANVVEFLWTATSPPEYDVNAEIDEESEQSSSSNNSSIHRDRSRSRDSDLDLGDRLLDRGASRSRSNTTSSGTASSAKTTPRKKSK